MARASDRRTGFSRRRQMGVFLGYVLAVAGAVLGAVLLLLSTFNPALFSGLRMGAAGATTPIAATLAAAGRAAVAVPRAVGDHFRVKSENARLRRELAAASRLLTRARTIHYDNRRLRALLAVRDASDTMVATARLVGSTASSTRRFALLNAGRWSGVRPGMPVRGPDGLVGRVTEAGPNAARVLLVTDPDSAVPVRRTRDGLPAIVAGRGDGAVEVRSVEVADVRFRPGDLFVTSGIGGLYAPGIPVARVGRPGRDTVVARPVADPDLFDFATVQRPFMPLPPSAPPPASPAGR